MSTPGEYGANGTRGPGTLHGAEFFQCQSDQSVSRLSICCKLQGRAAAASRHAHGVVPRGPKGSQMTSK